MFKDFFRFDSTSDILLSVSYMLKLLNEMYKASDIFFLTYPHFIPDLSAVSYVLLYVRPSHKNSIKSIKFCCILLAHG